MVLRVWVASLIMIVLTAGASGPAAPQPAPYVEEEITIVAAAGHTLSGALTLPRTGTPSPAVVLISGSGPQDRDETIPGIPGYRPFHAIADHLGRNGIAVLRYDDRGTGKSTGNHATASSADFADDAEAAWRFVRSRRDIHSMRIGLLGHSEGAIIAAMVAARNPRVAFVISMAGPAVNGYDALLVQNARILESLGAPPDAVTAGVAQTRRVLDLVRAGEWEPLRALLTEIIRRQIASLPDQQRQGIPSVEALVEQQMTFNQYWMRFFLSHDPGKDWERVGGVPVLGLFGVLDVQVDLRQNRPALIAALERAGNSDVTVAVFPRANHLFQLATTGSPREYATLPPAFLPGFLETISGWIRPRFVDK